MGKFDIDSKFDLTDDSQSSVYGDVFQKLYDQIKSAVDDANDRCTRLESIDRVWEFISLHTFRYVLSPMALESPQKVYEELYRLRDYLKNKIYDKLQAIPVAKKTRPEKVMNTFFNILSCYRLLCIETGKIFVNQQVTLDTPPTDEYKKRFREAEILPPISEDDLEDLIDRLQGKAAEEEENSILHLLTYDCKIRKRFVKT